MSRVYSDTVLPEDSGVSQDQTLGTTGDTVQVTSGASLNVNTVKDSGGNTLFTSDGSGVLSSLNAAFQGKPTLITANTVTDQASVDFTTGITSTYKLYIFRFYAINPATDGTDFGWQANASGESGYNETITSAAFRARHTADNVTAVLGYDTALQQAQGTGLQFISNGMGSEADETLGGELFLFIPSSTTYAKQFYSRASQLQSNAAARDLFVSGYINTTSAITEIQFKMASGNMDGIINLYGL